MIRIKMTPERYKELSVDLSTRLTQEEMDAGWRFCICEWDGMLVNINDTEGEGSLCTCFRDKDEGVIER